MSRPDISLQQILDSIQDGILVLDREFRVVAANKNARRLLGEACEGCAGRHACELLPKSDSSVEGCPAVECLESGRPSRTIIPYTDRRYDDEAWIEISAYPLLDDTGTVTGIVQTLRDVTSVREAGLALKESEDRFRRLFEESNDGILIHDSNGHILNPNRKACRMLGHSKIELAGLSLRDLVAPSEREAFDAVMAGFAQTRSARFETRMALKDGGEIVAEVSTRLVDPESGLAEAIVRDITAAKQAEEHMRRLKIEAEEASRMKSKFLATVSHEIRTPLNGIIGFCELILGAPSLDKAREYAQTVLRESEALHKLINNLLDHAKIEAGKLDIERHPVDLERFLERDIRGTSEVLTREKGLSFLLVLDPAMPRWVMADSLRLRQVLINLINNAIKFTSEGSVAVRVEVLDASEGEVRARFSVIDTGIGIPADKLDSIFESFTQAEQSTTRRFGGTGLGTTIARQLVELMGGRMGVESEVGNGSAFWFEIPLPVCAAPPQYEGEDAAASDYSFLAEASSSSLPRIARRRVLVAEDYPPNQMVVKMHLENEGHEVVLAENGRIAVDLFAQSPFDLVIMDVQMPEMDGYDATRAIRALQSGNGSRVPIMGLTANADLATREACIEAGMDEAIAKPLRRHTLLETVGRILAPQQAAPRPEKARTADAPPAEAPLYVLGDQPLAVDTLIAEFNNNKALVESTIDLFVRGLDEHYRTIETAIGANDLETARREAHRIKGGAGNLTAMRLWEAAAAVERSIKEDRLELLEGAMKAFKTAMQELKEFGEAYRKTP